MDWKDKATWQTEAQKTFGESLLLHIQYVQESMWKMGLGREQIEAHDLSKWTDEEFPAYAEWFHGPKEVPPSKERANNWARAWLHHIHYNPHHWQHWIYPDGYTPKGSLVEGGVVSMPYVYILEMVADWEGASMAYTGSKDMTQWLTNNMGRITVHSETALKLRDVLDGMAYSDVVFRYPFANEVGPGVPKWTHDG